MSPRLDGPQLYGADVPPDALRRFADLLGIEPAQDPLTDDVPPDTVVKLMPRPAMAGAIHRLAADRYPVLLENGPGWDAMATRTAAACRLQGLYLSVSTATAFSTDMAGPFCDALAERGAFQPDRRDDIVLATSEAVANAVMHGNLELDGTLRSRAAAAEDFMKVSTWLSEQATKPAYAERRLDMIARWQAGPDDAPGWLEVVVADQGRGYDPGCVTGATPDAPAGRGLSIIRERTIDMQVEQGGTRLVMRFAR